MSSQREFLEATGGIRHYCSADRITYLIQGASVCSRCGEPITETPEQGARRRARENRVLQRDLADNDRFHQEPQRVLI